ncbi:MAG: helix-turn-helix domain-containing protein [Verrucomicrobiota bacterium]|nr:helix-turn-helix domain-containing protein [Verrucomicrobiota bacterium]
MIQVDDFKAFDANEVAKMLDMKYRTVTRYIQAGKIRARKIGKKYFVTEQDVKAFILAQSTNVENTQINEYTAEDNAYEGQIRED